MTMKDKVDETIVAMCNEIQREIKGETFDRYGAIPNMVSALAELVSARAQIGSFPDNVTVTSRAVRKAIRDTHARYQE
jgi:hypothetical protein